MQRALGIVLAAALTALAPADAAELTGVNLAGAEFGGLNGQYGYAYIYPDLAQIRAFAEEGVNVIRVPIRWERIQPALNGPLDEDEARRLDVVIAQAAQLGLSTIIDIHSYGKYRRQKIGSAATPPAAFNDLWRRLAQRHRNKPKVIFGLMNEPVGIAAPVWAGYAEGAVRAIRATGARQLVLVPGANWSGAHSWRNRVGGQPSNAEALASFRDPGNNFAFDFHQYFDGNSSGQSVDCVAVEEAERRLAVATNWLRQTGHRGMLTEFGVARSPHCLNVLRAALRHLTDNDEWHGWTAWASAAWFGTYPFNLYPLAGERPPQLDVLRPFHAR